MPDSLVTVLIIVCSLLYLIQIIAVCAYQDDHGNFGLLKLIFLLIPFSVILYGIYILFEGIYLICKETYKQNGWW